MCKAQDNNTMKSASEIDEGVVMITNTGTVNHKHNTCMFF